MNERIQLRLKGGDPLQMRFDNFRGRELFATDARGGFRDS
jgi:hypothetical protein